MCTRPITAIKKKNTSKHIVAIPKLYIRPSTIVVINPASPTNSMMLANTNCEFILCSNRNVIFNAPCNDIVHGREGVLSI